jgi:hypothetical protein
MARPIRAAGAALLTLSLAFGAVACSSDGDDTPSGPTVAPELLPPKTVTSSSEATTTSTTAVAPVGAPDSAQAAQALYDAWVAGDRNAAARVAEPAAIDVVWSAIPGPYQLYRGCDDGEFDTSGCLFRDRTTNHTIQIEATRRDTGWVVTGAFFSES